MSKLRVVRLCGMCPKRFLTVAAILCNAVLIQSETGFPQDTYINALQNSQQSDIGDNSGNGYNYSPPLDNNYLPPTTPAYAPPAPAYGPPAPVYGPPAPVYGPPLTFYKPAHFVHPRDHWFLEKLKSKINLFAIGKIILKLLIFKKIVKFIAIICMLLFLPKLKGLFKDNMSMDEDEMETKQIETENNLLERRIEELYDFVIKAISGDQTKFN